VVEIGRLKPGVESHDTELPALAESACSGQVVRARPAEAFHRQSKRRLDNVSAEEASPNGASTVPPLAADNALIAAGDAVEVYLPEPDEWQQAHLHEVYEDGSSQNVWDGDMSGTHVSASNMRESEGRSSWW